MNSTTATEPEPSTNDDQPPAENVDDSSNSKRPHLITLPFAKRQLHSIFEKQTVIASDTELDDEALERYRALDTLAATVFQIGVTAFFGGVAVGLAVPSLPYRGIIIAGSVLPLSCGCIAGLAMVDESDATPTFDRLAEKRTSINRTAVFLVASICGVLAIIGMLLGFTSKLN